MKPLPLESEGDQTHCSCPSQPHVQAMKLTKTKMNEAAAPRIPLLYPPKDWEEESAQSRNPNGRHHWMPDDAGAIQDPNSMVGGYRLLLSRFG